MKLYELPSEWAAIEDELYENGGELTEELSARIEALGATLEQKVDSYYRLIANSEATETALKAEAKKLTERAKVAETNATTFKTRLQMALTGLGKGIGEKIYTADGTHYAALKENPPKVVVDESADVSKFEDRFKRLVPEKWEAEKTAIKDAFKAGEAIPEGVQVIRETSITVR